ncbi:MAG: hypothetical protein CME45_08540 [Halieaceae bacterium]|nr:hypothetical protein [Halieaceae bacterium]
MITRILIAASLVLCCSLCLAEDFPEDTNEIKSLTAEQAAEQQPPGQTAPPGLIGRLKDVEPLNKSGEKPLQNTYSEGDRGTNEGTHSELSFYGITSVGSRIAFVCDISGSMGGDKFIKLKDELLNSVSQLSPETQFYVIFFQISFTHFFSQNLLA